MIYQSLGGVANAAFSKIISWNAYTPLFREVVTTSPVHNFKLDGDLNCWIPPKAWSQIFLQHSADAPSWPSGHPIFWCEILKRFLVYHSKMSPLKAIHYHTRGTCSGKKGSSHPTHFLHKATQIHSPTDQVEGWVAPVLLVPVLRQHSPPGSGPPFCSAIRTCVSCFQKLSEKDVAKKTATSTFPFVNWRRIFKWFIFHCHASWPERNRNILKKSITWSQSMIPLHHWTWEWRSITVIP